MPRKYYTKEIPDSGLLILGNSLRFDLLETEDAALIAELDKCIARGVGGIISLTEDQYNEELKKKSAGILSNGGLRKQPQRQELSALHLPRHLAAGAGGTNPDGQFAKPQTPVGRTATPHLRSGLPNGQGPSAQMPDPIEVPSAAEFSGMLAKPPTAKMSSVKAQ